MKLYQRYLLSPLRLFIPLFLGAFGGLYLTVEFFEKLEDALNSPAGITTFLLYLLLRLPEILFQIWPPALALALLAAMAYLSRGQELLALRTLGFSPLKLIRPYILTALVLSLGMSLFLALTLPRTAYQALYTWEVRIKGQRPQSLLAQGKLFFTGPEYFVSARPLEPRGELLADFLFVEHRAWQPVRIIYAQKARFLGKNRWLLWKGMLERRIQEFHPRVFDRLELSLPFSPEILLSIKRPLKALTFRELRDRYNFLKASGLSAAGPLSEILYRLLYPFLAPAILWPSLALFLVFRGKRALAKGLSAGLLSILGIYTWFLAIRTLAAGGYLSPLILFPVGLLFPLLLGTFLLRRYAY